MTVANQIYERFKSIIEFSRYCEKKYGITADYMSKRISTGEYSKKILAILKSEKIELPPTEDERKERVKESVANYLRETAKEIKNWRAGL